MEPKKANATIHKGAGGSTRGMQSAKVSTNASFNKGAREGKSKSLDEKQNGKEGDSRKVDKLYSTDYQLYDIRIVGASDEKEYDGEALTKNAVSIYGLPAGFTGTATVSGTQTNVGSSNNEVTAYHIYDEEGNEVTSSFPNLEVVDGTLTVVAKPVTVTAEDKTKVYGADDPEFTATEEGLLDGDSISYTLGRAEDDTQNVGDHAIVVSGEEYQGNYKLVGVNGTLAITRAEATVTVDNKTKNAGDADPELTATVSGLKYDDTASVLSFELSREEGETAGTYAINASGAEEQGNYSVSYVAGTLTIS